MVARRDVIAAHQHDVSNTERGRPQQIGLQREPVAISHRQLHDWL